MEQKLRSFSSYLHEKPKRALAAGLLLYSAMFALLFCSSYLKVLLDTGTLMGGDGVAQFYPYAIEFRRMLISFFDSLGNGSPTVPMISMNFAFGSDDWTSVVPNFLPLLPYYIFLPLVPLYAVHNYWAIGSVLMLYLAGLAFFFMCRHFGKDPLIAGFFSAFFSFCGNTFHTALPNQQLLYILISMPVLTVGIDRIITKKGFALFPLAVCWLSLSGIVQLFYTIPFVVVFALIRVYFVYPKSYFRSLGICFLRGAGACLLGLAMGAVILLPCISDYLNGARVTEQIELDIGSLLIPDIGYLKQMLEPSTDYFNVSSGILSVGIPFVIWSFSKVKGSRELKWYSAVMILLVSLPIVRYALNAFRYTLCRWGSVPGMLMCFLCVSAAEDIIHEFSAGNCKKQVIFTSVLSVIYLALIAVGLSNAAVILLCAVLLFTMMPFAEKALDGAGELIKKIIAFLKAPTPASKAVSLGIFIVAGLGLILYFVYALTCKFAFAALITAIIAFAAACIAALVFGKAKRAIALLCSACLIVSGALHAAALKEDSSYFYMVTELTEDGIELMKNETGPENDDGGFGRAACLNRDSLMMKSSDDPSLHIMFNDNSGSEAGEAKDTVKYIDKFIVGDLSLRYDIFDSDIFKSVINTDLFGLFTRICQDQSSIDGINNLPGFSAKEPLMSLLGLRKLYAFNSINNIYGVEKIHDDTDNPDGIFMYRNKYALPAGSTYSNIMEKERYEALRPDEFPFAAMNEVYLEGEPVPENMSGSDISYAKLCDFTHESSFRGTTSYGMDCYNNTVHIKDDVSDCFLYITFRGVYVEANPNSQFEKIFITIDDDKTAMAQIHNRISTWEWQYVSDTYTLSLGHHTEDVDKLEFVTPFRYTDFYISAVPTSVYISAYENVSAEKLEDLALSENTLTGNVTVSEDKALVINLVALKGWRAYVDGRQAPIYKANGVFIGLPLTAGTHDIRLEYVTAYLPEGLLITAAAAVLLIIICIVKRRLKKRSVVSSGNDKAVTAENYPGEDNK